MMRPIYIHVHNDVPLNKAAKAPSVPTKGKRKPSENMAKVGPPTMPLIDKAASIMPPGNAFDK